jgi:hypothetical protein
MMLGMKPINEHEIVRDQKSGPVGRMHLELAGATVELTGLLVLDEHTA